MKQCKALLKKEWDTNWAGVLIPLWITGGVYVTALIGWIISLIRGHDLGALMQVSGMPAGYDAFMLYGTAAAITTLLGFVSLLSAAGLADSVINGGFKRRCEILHFSQPVSFLKIAGSKFLLVSLAVILLFGVLSLLNAVVITAVGRQMFSGEFHYGLTGWLQSFVGGSLTILFVGSLAWLFAGVFKRKSFLMGLLVLLAIEVVIGVLNYTTGWRIPSLFEFLGRMVALKVEIDPSVGVLEAPDVQAVISRGWHTILSWTSALKLALSAVFTVAGAWLYKFRELS
jgi:ABC-type transport system involved in multi-copper enzyme maturation permease subunit